MKYESVTVDMRYTSNETQSTGEQSYYMINYLKVSSHIQTNRSNFGIFCMVGHIGKMVLPFQPLTIAFKDVQYFVETPPVISTTIYYYCHGYVYFVN